MTTPAGPAPPFQPSEPQDGAAADSGFRTLDPKVIVVNRITGAITGAVLAAGALFALLLVLIRFGLFAGIVGAIAWLLFVAGLAWLAWSWPRIEFRYYRYRISPEGIEIRSGVWWRVRVSVPRSRVQHIDVSQGPLERSYGLATLSIYTAGTEHAKVGVSGLDHGVALAARDALLPRDAAPAV